MESHRSASSPSGPTFERIMSVSILVTKVWLVDVPPVPDIKAVYGWCPTLGPWVVNEPDRWPGWLRNRMAEREKES